MLSTHSTHSITETLSMIREDNLDIRTITLGVSLRDCADPDIDAACRKLYDKICKRAERLVAVGDELEATYGVPIINKRISVTPISLIAEPTHADDYTPFAAALDKAADATGVDFIGGFTALVHKGYTHGDRVLIDSIPSALSATRRVCSSVNIATTRAGLNMDACAHMGDILLDLAYRTRESGGLGCAKLVVFANAVEDNPFMAGAFYGAGEGECALNVGVSGPGAVRSAIARYPDAPFEVLTDVIKRTAFRITRVGQLILQEAAKRLDVDCGIVDLSLAPTPKVGDSVAHILEEMGVERAGTHGTTAALAMLNDAVKKGGVMATNRVGGLSGAFIPVSEDVGMIDAVEAGALSLSTLEAMTAVCSVGLDMVAVPGDTPSATLAAIIADEAAIGVINNKTTAVRIIPAYGYSVGDTVEFGGLLGTAIVMPVNGYGSERLIKRGGRFPAPLCGLRN